jgi:hypothetical protein
MGKVQKAWHSLKQTFFFFLLPVVFLGVTVCPCLEQAPLLQTIIRQSHVPVNRPAILQLLNAQCRGFFFNSVRHVALLFSDKKLKAFVLFLFNYILKFI